MKEKLIGVRNGEMIKGSSADRIFIILKFLYTNLDGCCIRIGI